MTIPIGPIRGGRMNFAIKGGLMPHIKELTEVKRVYLIGICGTAMASLAGMLQQRGYEVGGSDEHVYPPMSTRSEEHTSELQSQSNLVCRLLLEKKNAQHPVASVLRHYRAVMSSRQ